MKFLKIVIAMISFSVSDGQIALPTIQAVHKPHNASNGTPENPLGDSGLTPPYTNVNWNWMMGHTLPHKLMVVSHNLGDILITRKLSGFGNTLMELF